MSRRRSARETISLGAEAASVWFRYNLVEPLRSQPGLPRAMHFISTHRCNARCVMCGIWKESGTQTEELSPEALSGILGDRLFSCMSLSESAGGSRSCVTTWRTLARCFWRDAQRSNASA